MNDMYKSLSDKFNLMKVSLVSKRRLQKISLLNKKLITFSSKLIGKVIKPAGEYPTSSNAKAVHLVENDL